MSDEPQGPEGNIVKFEPVANLQIKREQKMYLDRTSEVLGKIVERNANSGPNSRQDMLDLMMQKQAFESLSAGLMRRPYDEACRQDINDGYARLISTNLVHYASRQELEYMGWKEPAKDDETFVFDTSPEK